MRNGDVDELSGGVWHIFGGGADASNQRPNRKAAAKLLSNNSIYWRVSGIVGVGVFIGKRWQLLSEYYNFCASGNVERGDEQFVFDIAMYARFANGVVGDIDCGDSDFDDGVSEWAKSGLA